MSKLICLDPGHGGKDPGAVNASRRESDDNLRLAFAVRGALERQKLPVLMTRDNDTHVTLKERTDLANNAKADLFVSLHRNAFTNDSANGLEIWVHSAAGAAECAAACEVMELLARTGVQCNRGIKKGNYHVCRETLMPAMLIELGFITNGRDNELFDKNIDSYATAITKGICAALGHTYNEESGGLTKTTPLYRVQVGAFNDKGYAEAFLASVRSMGLPAFMVESAPVDGCS